MNVRSLSHRMKLIFFPSILFFMISVPPLVIVYYDNYFTRLKIDPWQNFTEDAGPWCEKPKNYGLVKEKSNAYSDYIFLLTGTYLLLRSCCSYNIRDSDNLLKLLPNLSYLYVFINLFHGAGTFINHSCRCSFGHMWDVIGMFAIINFWISYYVLRYFYYKNNNVYLSYNNNRIILSFYKRYVIMFVTLSIIVWPLTSIKYSSPYSERSEFFVVMSGGIVCLYLDYMTKQLCNKKAIILYFMFKNKCVYIGISIISIGALMHKLDIRGIFCDPEHFIQLHALWHVCAAITTVIIYEHARSEFPYYMNLPFIKKFPSIKSP